jgi:diguanylate cyclase
MRRDSKSRGNTSHRHIAAKLAPVIAAAAIGIAVSAAASFFVSLWDDRIAKLEFQAVAENHFMVLQDGINKYLSNLIALRALFESSDHAVSRSEFEAFAERLIHDQPGIQSVSWAPRVTRNERVAIELAAAGDGIPDYCIRAVRPDNNLTVSPDRDEYFPILFSTERPRTSPVYGIDLASEPMRRGTVERARDNGGFATSANFELHSGAGNRHGFFVLLPVYARDLPHETIGDRRRNLIGLVQGAFQIEIMTKTILNATTKPRGLDLYFFSDTPVPANELSTYLHASRLGNGSARPKSMAMLTAGLYAARELKVGDTPWTVAAAPAAGVPINSDHDRAWIVLAAGLIISGLAVSYLCDSARRARRLEIANRKISLLAHTDPLTGLANRREFLERLETAFAAARRDNNPFAVLYADLDYFKDVNDTLGHPLGDLLLRQAAERISSVVRQTDLVARFGGDEFAVLQTDVADLAAAGTLAERVGKMLTAPYLLAGNEVHITASVGVARYSPDLADAEAIMMQADLALYRAKTDGRNCYRFHSDGLDREVHERVKLAQDLRHAIERGEFELYYQPQVELASGRIVGLEALLRWNHPSRGLLMPALFIPAAERTGLILELGTWAFEQVCRQLKLWQEMAIAPQVVAVNVSAIQFKAPRDLEGAIAGSLARWRVAPSNVELELTETVLMEVSRQHNEVLERLRELGIKLAIDDFGTGYSSLNYLTTYPVSRLKIAQELVFRVTTDARNATVVRAAIRLAGELGIELIAEGVETEQQARFLIEAGCEYAQGYYFSRPVDAEHATALLRQAVIEPDRKSPAITMAGERVPELGLAERLAS